MLYSVLCTKGGKLTLIFRPHKHTYTRTYTPLLPFFFFFKFYFTLYALGIQALQRVSDIFQSFKGKFSPLNYFCRTPVCTE